MAAAGRNRIKIKINCCAALVLVLIIVLQKAALCTYAEAASGENGTLEDISVPDPEGKYRTHRDGTCGVEIGISSENKISLDSETLVFDFTEAAAPLGDEVNASVRASYVLTNASTKEENVSIAVPELLRLEKVTVKREEAQDFESGRSIIIDGKSVNGMIYANSKADKLLSDSVYDSMNETLASVDYNVFFEEGFSMYSYAASLEENENNQPENDTADYYRESEEGELYLCSVIYNLNFEPGSSHSLEIESDILGEMNRATKYTDMGTSYTYLYIGENINSFYRVGDITVTFKLPESGILPMIECDAARYLDDGVWTVRYKGRGDNFSFTLGEKLTDEEITDVYTAFGKGKLIINAVEVVSATLVLVSAVYIGYTVKKRKESGISNKNFE